MLKKCVLPAFWVILIMYICSGCATVFKGYEDKIKLNGAPDSIKVFTKDGLEIPIRYENKRHYSYPQKAYVDSLYKVIYLRSNKEHTLTLKYPGKEKKVELYPRLGGVWLTVDFLLGVVPAFIDGYTGNWNHFEDINVSF